MLAFLKTLFLSVWQEALPKNLHLLVFIIVRGIIINIGVFHSTIADSVVSMSFSSLGDSTVVNEIADIHGTMTSAPATADSIVVDIPDLIPLTLDANGQQLTDSAKIDLDKNKKADPKGVEEVLGGNVTPADIPKSTAAPSIGGKSVKPKTMTAAAQVIIIIN